MSDEYAWEKNWHGRISIALAIILAYGAWVKYTDEKEKDRKNQDDGVKKDIDQREKELTERQKDYSLKFYERRAAAYEELCEVCSRIAITQSLKSAEPDLKRLQQFYDGKLALLADDMVMDEVYQFIVVARRLTQKGDENDIDKAASRVAAICRDSLRSAFPNVPFITHTPPRIKATNIPE